MKEKMKKKNPKTQQQPQQEQMKTAGRRNDKQVTKKNLSLKSMFAEIESYGYHYSFKQFLLQLVIVWGIMGVAAYFYKMALIPVIILAVLCTVLTPVMILAQYRYKYEYNKFNDVSDYLQQMATSFLKTKKIRDSLDEVAVILNGRRIHSAIMEAIDFLDNHTSDTYYEDAFAKIEQEYGCEKMTALHKYLIKVEAEGGEFESTLSLMMSDNLDWVQRTSVYQQRRKSTHFMILVAIVMSLIMCGVLNAYVPDAIPFEQHDGSTVYASLAINGRLLYQITSTIFLGLMIGLYTLTQTLMQGSWLKDKGVRKDKEIVRDYRYYKYWNYKDELKKYLLWFVVLIFVAGVAYFILGHPGFALIFLVSAFYYLSMPRRKLRNAKKRLDRDLEKAFPEWVRDVSISLNTQTVQNAIIMSENKAPTVLKPHIHQLIEEFTADPVSYLPWAHFLEDFDVPEAKSAARMFYSINELSGESAKIQINSLIQRNARAVKEADEKKAEDEITTLSTVIIAPMAISIFKLIVDLILLILQFITLTNMISGMM